jgi:hypothetical protein
MASAKKFAALFLALTLLIIAIIIGTSLISPTQYNGDDNNGGTQQLQNNDPSLSNGTSLTVMDELFEAPEYGQLGSLVAIIAGLVAVFVVYQRKK